MHKICMKYFPLKKKKKTDFFKNKKKTNLQLINIIMFDFSVIVIVIISVTHNIGKNVTFF